MKPKYSRLFPSTLFAVGSITTMLATQPAQAATKTWNKTTGGDFNTAGNWNTSGVPVAADLALFNSAQSAAITLSANATPGAINFGTDASAVTVGVIGGNTITLGNGQNISVLSTLTGTGKTLTINAPLVLTPASPTTAGTFYIQNNSAASSNIMVIGGGITSSTTSNTETLTLAGVSSGANLISGNIANGAATTFALIKQDIGNWNLSGITNSYTGATIVNGGTLNLTGGGKITGTSGLTVNGGAFFIDGDLVTAANNSGVTDRVKASTTLTLNGGKFQLAAAEVAGVHSQSFNTLNLGSGVSTLSTNAATGTNTLTFSAAAASNYARANGGLVNINTQAGFNVAFTNAATTNAVGSGADALLIGAVLNGSDFIAAAAGNVGAAAYTPTGTTDWTAGKNMNVTGTNVTAYTAADVNSARFNAAGANTVTLDAGTNTIAGGILVTSNVGANASAITGGTIQAASGKDLLVIQNNSVVGGDLTIGSAIANNVGSAFTKTGVGKLILSGLSATAANNYAGTTIIDQGTVAITSTADLTGGLTIGGANGSTSTASLDLGGASATFGGATLVQTNSTTANTIAIGSGQTLLLNGAVTIGSNGDSAGTTTKLNVSGLGTLAIGTSVAATNAKVQLGGNLTGTTAVNNAATLDLSGLSSFSAYLGTGKFQVGDSVNSNGVNSGGIVSTLILATNNVISAASLNTDSASVGGTTAGNLIKLGSGTNVLNVAELAVGGSTGGRGNGSLVFNGSTGTLTVRSQADPVNGRATLNISNMSTGATIGTTGNFDTTGHFADLKLNKITIASRSAGTGGGPTGTLSFDTGTLDANDLIVGSKTTANTSAFNGTVNLGGTGVAIFNSSTSAMRIGSNTTAASVVSGTLNISGTTSSVTVAANGGNSIILGNSTFAGVASPAATGSSANGTVNITGGTLTVAGDIVRGSFVGNGSATSAGNSSSTAVLKLDGGILDMGGKKIGGSAATGNLTTLTFASGTLKNVAEINNGATLNKTTGGTLTLEGTNAYTGTTTVTTGKLLVNGTNTGIGAFTVNSSTTLGGTGSIAAAVNVTGVLSPGASIESLASGALTMNTGSTFAYEATGSGASGADLMVVNGALSLTGVTLDLSGADLSLGTWLPGTKLTLFSYTGSAITSGFTGYTDDTEYTFGANQWFFDYNDTLKGNNFASDAPSPAAGVWFVTATAIPEPAAALLGGLGVLTLLRRRRS